MARTEAGPIGAHHYRVGDLIIYLRELFSRDPVLADVWVSGEMTDVTRSSAGHWYFTLRDGDARIGVVVFRASARRQSQPPAEGHQALVHGAVDIYDQRSVYQLIADVVLPGETGRMRAQFEALRARLDKEGLFAPERKRRLPGFPKRVGIVTSQSGAALHDILRVWERRFPMLEVLLAPTAVQGEEAVRGIVMALDRLNAYHEDEKPLDAIILTRGGGSPEELATFNEEAIARAIYASHVPVVSAIGHEVDWTIADLVADLRCPTPSAAAEMVVPDAADLQRHLTSSADRLRLALARRVRDARSAVERDRARLASRSPVARLQNDRTQTDDLAGRADRALGRVLASARSDVANTGFRMTALNPTAILDRGYAVCTRADDGVLVMDPSQVGIGDLLAIRLARGSLLSEVATAPTLPPRVDLAGKEKG
ncbi:MAG: exodeoxyribonuclease VII large subunit [Chloroflexi bacterium]|nr:exodeoxyribonuclease VII large subunit [Chloroflexota bacterium]